MCLEQVLPEHAGVLLTMDQGREDQGLHELQELQELQGLRDHEELHEYDDGLQER